MTHFPQFCASFHGVLGSLRGAVQFLHQARVYYFIGLETRDDGIEINCWTIKLVWRVSDL